MPESDNEKNSEIFSGISEFVTVFEEDLSNARRELLLFSGLLPRIIYGKDTTVRALTKTLSNQRELKINILVTSTSELLEPSHPYKGLCQKLPSRIEIRKLRDPIFSPGEDFALFDRSRLIEFTDSDSSSGIHRTQKSRQSINFNEIFVELWTQRSEPIADLRSLYL